jgi:hypothetical protein
MTDTLNPDRLEVRAIAEMVVDLLAERGLIVYAGPDAAARVPDLVINVDDAAIGSAG